MNYGQDQHPEIVHALKYLTKLESVDSRITKLKTWILEKKMDYLDETEANWVNENIKKGYSAYPLGYAPYTDR